jgi:hypothetical protein
MKRGTVITVLQLLVLLSAPVIWFFFSWAFLEAWGLLQKLFV